MRQSIFAVTSCRFTSWVNAGQPSLDHLTQDTVRVFEQKEYEHLNLEWEKGKALCGDCDERSC